MGRKSTKAKERKQKRKEENAKLAAVQAKVNAANKIENPLAMFPVFQNYDRNGLSVTIECKRVAELDKETVEWIFGLIKTNMETFYEDSEWGWRDKEKREEMTEEAAWYLIVRDQDKMVGFIHFRFDMDFDDEVLYVYELQLIKEVRRKGLGKFLMQILELLAHKTEMKKVIQTVFLKNMEGYNFYTKTMKYEMDETNPDENVWEEGNSYVILSKIIKPRKSDTAASTNASVVESTNGEARITTVSS